MHDRTCKDFLHKMPDLIHVHVESVPRSNEERQHLFKLTLLALFVSSDITVAVAYRLPVSVCKEQRQHNNQAEDHQND